MCASSRKYSSNQSLPAVGGKTAQRYALKILEMSEGEVEEFAHSYSYRVGSTLLTLPRKLREALSKGTKGPKES